MSRTVNYVLSFPEDNVWMEGVVEKLNTELGSDYFNCHGCADLVNEFIDVGILVKNLSLLPEYKDVLFVLEEERKDFYSNHKNFYKNGKSKNCKIIVTYEDENEKSWE